MAKHKMYIALFLHIYQPPSQKKEIVSAVAQECYIPILKELLKNPEVKVTLNISGCLLDLLHATNQTQFFAELQKALDNGQVELVQSSAYHAFLPKVGQVQMERQIDLQKESLTHYFKNEDLLGFFPPEMAFDPKMATTILKAGCKWVVLDESAKSKPPSNTRLYKDANGLYYFFRDREISFKLASSQIKNVAELKTELQKDPKKIYQVLALDGETFGHHNKDYINLLGDFFKCYGNQLINISGLLNLNLPISQIKPKKSSWTILDKKRLKKFPFIRWSDPDNEIHKMQWKLTNMAIKASHSERSLKKLDKALFSCQYWWACAKPWWYIEMIESGSYMLLNCIINSESTVIYKKRAATIYHKIITKAFDWMRTGKMQKMVDSEHEHQYTSKEGRHVNV